MSGEEVATQVVATCLSEELIMEFGLGLPINDPARLPEWARLAEEHGFATIALLDRLAYDNPEPLTALAVLAGSTTRIRLQTEVLLGPLRSTALLAKQVATLDQMSAGRFVLGIGIGGREDDHAAAGVPLHRRGRLLDTQLAHLKAIWRGEPYRAEPHGAEPRGAEPYRAEPYRAEPRGAEPYRAEPYRAEPRGAEPHRAEPHRAALAAGENVRSRPAGTLPTENVLSRAAETSTSENVLSSAAETPPSENVLSGVAGARIRENVLSGAAEASASENVRSRAAEAPIGENVLSGGGGKNVRSGGPGAGGSKNVRSAGSAGDAGKNVRSTQGGSGEQGAVSADEADWGLGRTEHGPTAPIGPKPFTPGGPPILIGGFAPQALRRVALFGDGFICAAPLTWAGGLVRTVNEQWKDAGRAGRPRLVCQINAAVGSSESVERGRRAVADYYAFTGRPGWGAPLSDPAQIADTVAAYREFGADELIFYCYGDDPRQVELLAGLSG